MHTQNVNDNTATRKTPERCGATTASLRVSASPSKTHHIQEIKL